MHDRLIAYVHTGFDAARSGAARSKAYYRNTADKKNKHIQHADSFHHSLLSASMRKHPARLKESAQEGESFRWKTLCENTQYLGLMIKTGAKKMPNSLSFGQNLIQALRCAVD
jgi:hypothetical protein